MKEKKTNLNSMVSNINSNMIRIIVVSVLSFASSVILTRHLGDDNYGIYSYMVWLTGILSISLTFGMENTLIKFIPEFNHKDIKEDGRALVVFTVRRLGLIIIPIMLLLALTVKYWAGIIGYGGNYNRILLIITLATVFPAFLNNLFTAYTQSVQRYDVYAKINVVSQLIVFAINVIIVMTINDLRALIVVLFLSNVCTAIAYGVFTFRDIGAKFRDIFSKVELKHAGRIKNYAYKMYINIMWQQVVWTRSEFFFLGIYSTPAQTAIYGVAFALNTMINMVFSPIMSVLNSYFSEMVARNEKDLLKSVIYHATKYFIIILVPALFVIIIFIKPLILLIYKEEFIAVAAIFPILFFSMVLTLITSVANAIPFYYEKQNFLLIAGISCAVVNILIDMALIPSYAALGATIAKAISQIGFSLVSFVYIYKNFKLKFPLKTLIQCILVSVIMFLIVKYAVSIMWLKIVITIFLLPVYIICLYGLKVIDKDDINMIKGLRKNK